MAGLAQNTSWGLILRARGDVTAEAREAMERLARSYWLPVYTHVRRKTRDAARAEDLTQEFFATFLEKGWISTVDRARGRFRTFLLVVLDRFLADQHDLERAAKRGGGRRAVPIDVELAERVAADPASGGLDPARAFTRDCALAVIRECLDELRQEMDEGGRPAYYEVFVRSHGFDGHAPHETYGGLARDLAIKESDVTNYLHRARQAFRRILEERVLQAVDSPDQVQAEIAALLEALTR